MEKEMETEVLNRKYTLESGITEAYRKFLDITLKMFKDRGWKESEDCILQKISEIETEKNMENKEKEGVDFVFYKKV